MRDLNKIILIGRLGSDPVQRETKTGNMVVHFPLATSRRVRQEASEQVTMSQVVSDDVDAEARDGDDLPGARSFASSESGWAEETVWHRVVVWGRQAETCSRFLKKGQPVYVEGSVRSRKYQGRDGVSRLAFEVHAESVGFLNGSPRRGSPIDATHSLGEMGVEASAIAVG